MRTCYYLLMLLLCRLCASVQVVPLTIENASAHLNISITVGLSIISLEF